MKNCSNCNELLDEGSNYCKLCGLPQHAEKNNYAKAPAQTPAIIVTLAILTLLGSAGGMIRGLFYQTFANLFKTGFLHNDGYQRGYILMVLNIGTFAAAIFMLQLKRSGYYLYLFFQLAYLLFTFYITFIYSTDVSSRNLTDGINPLVLLVSSVFWLPSTIMFILYLTLARKYFKSE